jgi:hypothetical protein
MIGQYLPNNNENATVSILPKILHLNQHEVVLQYSVLLVSLLDAKTFCENITKKEGFRILIKNLII